MLYAAKCYWPGVDQGDLERVAARAMRAPHSGDGVAYVGSLLFAHDDLVLCMFEGPSRRAVKRISESIGIPCERVMESAWLGSRRDEHNEALR
jgi:hypothetical protein